MFFNTVPIPASALVPLRVAASVVAVGNTPRTRKADVSRSMSCEPGSQSSASRTRTSLGWEITLPDGVRLEAIDADKPGDFYKRFGIADDHR